jgi:hypothetical protein
VAGASEPKAVARAVLRGNLYFTGTVAKPGLHHQRRVFTLLFECAVSTLKSFGLSSRALGGELGLTAELHTHSRRLAYHPHVHFVVPGGCLLANRRQWKKRRGTDARDKKWTRLKRAILAAWKRSRDYHTRNRKKNVDLDWLAWQRLSSVAKEEGRTLSEMIVVMEDAYHRANAKGIRA